MSDEKKAGGYILVEDEGWVLEGEEYESKPVEPEVEEEIDLESLTKNELIDMAADRGLDSSGNKADLIERLAD